MICFQGLCRLTLILAAGLLSCCPNSWAKEIILKQADGTSLTLDSPATRIITLSPHLAELVYAAGAGDRLIATVEYSNFPEPAVEIPRVGDAFRLDSERIVAFHPDLVIAWQSGNPRPAIEQLRSLAIPVWSLEISTPAEIADAIEAIGSATDQGAVARLESEKIRRRLERLSGDHQNAPPMIYFYQVGENPLFTINGNHLISRGLELCGGHNIFDGEPGLAFQVGYESVIAANPDALFAPNSGDNPDPLHVWREWPAMKAVRQNSLFLLPADSVSRATPRFLDALELACKLLRGITPDGADE